MPSISLCCDRAVIAKQFKICRVFGNHCLPRRILTEMNTRKRSASNRRGNSHAVTPLPPQPPSKRGAPQRRVTSRVENSRLLTEEDIPRIIQGVVQSLSDSTIGNSTTYHSDTPPNSGAPTTQRGRKRGGPQRKAPSGTSSTRGGDIQRSVQGNNSDNQSTAQTSTREDPVPQSQLMDESLNDGSSRTPAITPTAVPLIAPNPSHQTNDTHSSGTEAVLPHARK